MLKLKDIIKNTSDCKKTKALYISSFPKEERRMFWDLMRKSQKQGARFLGAYDEDEWVGFAYCIRHEDLVYVFFLAVEQENRNKGYGSQMLAAIKQQFVDCTLVLAVEQPDKNAKNNAERIRRIAFYEKNGFSLTPYQIKEAGVTYASMATGEVLPQKYNKLMESFYGKIGVMLLGIKML